jgi:hypothetical protein
MDILGDDYVRSCGVWRLLLGPVAAAVRDELRKEHTILRVRRWTALASSMRRIPITPLSVVPKSIVPSIFSKENGL